MSLAIAVASVALIFTNDWFDLNARSTWSKILPELRPRRILEIGSYEGAATCFAISTLAPLVEDLEIHCVDTWLGSVENQPGGLYAADMVAVASRFQHNTQQAIAKATCPVRLVCHQKESRLALAELIAAGRSGWFDFVYVDGSHQAADVLVDAVMSHQLVRVGGMIAFDDYLWSEHESELNRREPLCCPKLAIDAFTNIFFRKVQIISAPLCQIYVVKVED